MDEESFDVSVWVDINKVKLWPGICMPSYSCKNMWDVFFFKLVTFCFIISSKSYEANELGYLNVSLNEKILHRVLQGSIGDILVLLHIMRKDYI